MAIDGRKARSWILAALLLVLTPAAGATPRLLERAFDNMPPVEMDAWVYTLTTEEEDSVRVERHDPRSEPRWVLVSVNGREPTVRELDRHRKTVARREHRKDKPGDNDFANLALPGSWQLIEEGPERAVFRFAPKPDDDDEAAVSSSLTGSLVVDKTVPFVRSFRLYSTEPFRARLVAKIESVDTRIEMLRIAEKTYVPGLISTDVKGKALGLKSLDRKTVVRYSDFERMAVPPRTD